MWLKRASDYRKANPIGDFYLDAPEDENNYMLKKSEKEGIADWNKKFLSRLVGDYQSSSVLTEFIFNIFEKK